MCASILDILVSFCIFCKLWNRFGGSFSKVVVELGKLKLLPLNMSDELIGAKYLSKLFGSVKL